jgi:hypothetical protein
MEFTVSVNHSDSDGNPVTFVETFNAELDGTVLKVYQIIDSDESVLICDQPWKTNNEDGTRSDWSSVEEGVVWFKSLK